MWCMRPGVTDAYPPLGKARFRLLVALVLPLALLACGKRDDDRNLDLLDNEPGRGGIGKRQQ